MRSSLLFIFSGALGLLAAAMVLYNFGDTSDSKTIVIAASEIDAGSIIRAEQLKTIPWAASSLPQGVFEDAKQVAGRISRTSLVVGEPVFEFNLAKQAAMSGLSSVINEGSRAISVEANEVSGVAGFIVPGSYVDVLVSGKDMSGAAFSKIVLQYVRVLAVEQETKVNPEQPRVVRAVTLELSPQQSEQLDLARSIGKLSLALRNEFDKRSSQSPGARLNDLMAGAGTVPSESTVSVARTSPIASVSGATSTVYDSRPMAEEVRGTSAELTAD